MSSIITLTNIIAQLEATLAETKAALAIALAAEPAALAEPAAKKPKKAKKAVAETDSDAEPKEKKAPNAWLLFTGRVEQLVRTHEQTSGNKMKTMVVKQFASHLKSQKVYADWTDAEIIAQIDSFTPPEVSKKAAAAAEPAVKKAKKPQSDETKAKAAATKAANKAAKAVGPPTPPPEPAGVAKAFKAE